MIGLSCLKRSQKPSASWSMADGSGTNCASRGRIGIEGGLGYRLRQLEQSELLRPPLDGRVESEVRLEVGQVEGLPLQPCEQVRPQEEVPVRRLHGRPEDRR